MILQEIEDITMKNESDIDILNNKIIPAIQLQLFNNEININNLNTSKVNKSDMVGTAPVISDVLNESIMTLQNADDSIVKSKVNSDFSSQLIGDRYHILYSTSNSSMVYGYDTYGEVTINPVGTPKKYLVTNTKLNISNGGTFIIETELNIKYLISRYDANGTHLGKVNFTDLNPDKSITLPSDTIYINITVYKPDGKDFADTDVVSVKTILNSPSIVKIVDINGGGDYLSINDAVQSSSDQTVIIVMPGTYDECVSAFTKEVTIIGISKKHCILKKGTGKYEDPPLEIGAGYISNMTIHADKSNTVMKNEDLDKKAYGVHIDTDFSCGKTLEFNNCDIISDWCSAVGIGLRPIFTLKFKDCNLYGNYIQSYIPAFNGITCLGGAFFHDSVNPIKGKNQNIIFDNCKIKCKGTNALTIRSSNNIDNSMNVTFYNTMLWSGINGNGEGVISHKTTPSGGAWSGNNAYLTGDSYGNNVNEINM